MRGCYNCVDGYVDTDEGGFHCSCVAGWWGAWRFVWACIADTYRAQRGV